MDKFPGYEEFIEIQRKWKGIKEQYYEDLVWFEEILVECKHAFVSSKIELLPKTPSAKTRRKRKIIKDPIETIQETGKEIIVAEDEDADNEQETSSPPKKTYRTRGASKTSRQTRASKTKSSSRSTRNSKDTELLSSNDKENDPVFYEEGTKPTENSKFTSLKKEECFSKKNMVVVDTPEQSNSKPCMVKSPHSQNSCTRAGPGHVRIKVNAFEELIDSCSPAKSNTCKIPETPENDCVQDQCENIDDTPVASNSRPSVGTTPATVKRRSSVANLKKLKRLSSHCKLAKVTGSVRSSLKAGLTGNDTPTKQHSKNKLKLHKKKEIDSSLQKEAATPEKHLSDVSVRETGLSPSQDTTKEKKTSIVGDSVENDEEMNKTIVTIEEVNVKLCYVDVEMEGEEGEEIKLLSESEDNDMEVEEEEKEKNIENVPKDGCLDKDSECRKSLEKDELDGKTEEKTKVPEEEDSKDMEERETSKDFEEPSAPPARSTRTKTRKEYNSTASDGSAADVKVRTSNRTKQRKNTTNSSTSADESHQEMDSGIHSEAENKVTRCTRSKMRQPKQSNTSVSSENSDADDPFAVPDAPPVRVTRTKTRKRQLEEDLDTSLSKRPCPHDRSSSDSVCKSNESEDDEATNESSGDYKRHGGLRRSSSLSSLPKPKSFVHNLSNKINGSHNLSVLSTGVVRSFIKKNTPPPKLSNKDIIEQKKKELFEKEQKDKERIKQRNNLLKMKIEEQRKRREERMKRVAQTREQITQQEEAQKNKMKKKEEEKRQMTESIKEMKAAEEREKQKSRMKKQQEAEERRKQEEDERVKKLKEQAEEEEKRVQEALIKKKQEEEERLRKIAEEKKKMDEKLLEEKQAEMERLRKQQEEDKQREIQRQLIKEEREKAAQRAQAEKERLESEKKKMKEIQLQKQMEKMKENEKKKKELEEKRREKEQEEKRREEEINKLINHHNAVISSSGNSKTLPQPTINSNKLNTTQTIESKSEDSYEMTPSSGRSYRVSVDNYDINDMHSDDSTDEEDNPRKKVPAWAQGPELKALLISNYYHPPDVDSLFGDIIAPDLGEMFAKKKARFFKRTSSAHWDSPLLKPSHIVSKF